MNLLARDFTMMVAAYLSHRGCSGVEAMQIAYGLTTELNDILEDMPNAQERINAHVKANAS